MTLRGVCTTCNRNLMNFYYLRFIKGKNMEEEIKNISCLSCRMGILLNIPPEHNYPKSPKNELDSENVILS